MSLLNLPGEGGGLSMKISNAREDYVGRYSPSLEKEIHMKPNSTAYYIVSMVVLILAVYTNFAWKNQFSIAMSQILLTVLGISNLWQDYLFLTHSLMTAHTFRALHTVFSWLFLKYRPATVYLRKQPLPFYNIQ